jgi:hypothetical protein
MTVRDVSALPSNPVLALLARAVTFGLFSAGLALFAACVFGGCGVEHRLDDVTGSETTSAVGTTSDGGGCTESLCARPAQRAGTPM